jgi:DegV family protein with EDD domain
LTKIRIVTDSTSDIPVELAKEYSIEVIPMYVGLDGRLFKDQIEIMPEEVYAALDTDKKVTTSSPSVGDYISVFTRLLEQEKAEKIYCITLSARLSASFNAATVAGKMFAPDTIKIIDSKTSTMCQGLIAIQAAQAAESGKYSAAEIENIINELINRNKLIGVLENFKYLFKGGRAVFLGRFINKIVKFMPILHIGKNGKVQLKKFVKTREGALQEIYRQTVAAAKLNEDNLISIFYGRNEDNHFVKELESLIRQNKEISVNNIYFNTITTVMGAHTGPVIWGVAISPKLV